jgi:hypothetical protein
MLSWMFTPAGGPARPIPANLRLTSLSDRAEATAGWEPSPRLARELPALLDSRFGDRD